MQRSGGSPGGGAEAKVETDSWSVGSYSSQAWGPAQCLIYSSLCWSSTVEYLSIPVGRVHSAVSSVILRRLFDTISSSLIAALAALRREVVLTRAVSPWLWLVRSVDTAYLAHSFGLNVGYSCHESCLSRFMHTFFTLPAHHFLKDGASHFLLWLNLPRA